MKPRAALIAAGLLVLFNLWHLSSRPFWPGSVQNALSIGPNTIDLARETFPDLQIRRPYDGQFYFAIAHDPLLLSGRTVSSVDVPNYRFRRILYPLLGWMFSFGNPAHLPLLFFLINMFAWIACGVAAWTLARDEKMPPALVVVGIVGITGLQFAAFRTLCEPLALALLLWGLWFLKNSHWKSGFALMGVACLARETSVVAYFAAAFYFWRRYPMDRKKIIKTAMIALLPVILWNLYLPQRLSMLGGATVSIQPFAIDGGPKVVAPMTGLFRETKIFLAQDVTHRERTRTISISIATLLLMGTAFFLVWRRGSLWGVLAAAETVFCSMVQGNIWDYYAGSSRVIINLTAFVLLGLLTEKTEQKIS